MGLVFGKMVGEIEDVNLWILGVTGGFFLYIALTNKVGKVYCSAQSQERQTFCKWSTLPANCNLLTCTFHCFQLPELMHVTEQSDQSKIALFLLQNIGIIVGFVGMFFLAYYKKDINIL